MMRSTGFWIAILLTTAALVFAIRLSGPADLEGYAQARNIGYVMDLVERGNWLAQRDIEGRIISKPPLHTWAIAPFALILGVTRMALVIPSFIAIVALTLLVFWIGKRQSGVLAGGIAGLAVILAPIISKHVGLVRSDAMFTLWITAGAWSAWLAWTKGKSWTWFWLFAALSTLTKGPFGLIISASGLMAYFWEKKTGNEVRKPSGSHLTGVLLFSAIGCGWFFTALHFHGKELADKLLLDELLGQATGARKGSFPGANLPEPTLNLLSRFVPFSLLGFYGFWKAVKRPSPDADVRKFERFLVCWILPGLAILSLAAHHRGDLVLPLWPPLALLAGITGARIADRMAPRRLAWTLGIVGVLLLGHANYNYRGGTAARGKVIRYSENIRLAAESFRQTGIDGDEVMYIDTPTTFQMYLGTARIWDREEGTKAKIAAGERPRYLGTENETILPEDYAAAGAREIFRWPEHEDPPVVRIFEMEW